MGSADEFRPVVEGGGVTFASGFAAGAVYAGIKTPGPGKLDLAILVSDRPANVAGVFTQNTFCAAPVVVSRERVAAGRARAIVVNAGNANACTGEQGIADAREMTELAARSVDADPSEVLVASTGVIGVPMPMELIRQAIGEIELGHDGERFARAIITTDTRIKQAAAEVELSGRTVRIGGAAKGAGMIHPNMATMLAFVTTDAAVEPEFLQQALRAATADTFNMISIDGDTSTNDTLIVMANGAAQNPPVSGGSDGDRLTAALTYVCGELARAIVADGEGATRLIRVDVRGAASLADARSAARSVVRSNLLKAAVYGGDPNWGRVLCAIGYSGARVDPNAVDLFLGDVQLVRAGSPVPGSREAAGDLMKQPEVHFIADLHVGQNGATAWGCDLTEAYVVENSAYTT
ncbi:MAG: bifunctional glutamate N-acetyltransferase/amino-acid acetyltransferase ArgJ [Chloroflexi bacterium]|nr:bifunctional glutamate N-acetyltransferase/amino-acid acetyltransferase ArgJ [Chloroflexota bacterium]